MSSNTILVVAFSVCTVALIGIFATWPNCPPGSSALLTSYQGWECVVTAKPITK